MNKIITLIFSVLLLMAMSSDSFAGDYAEMKFIGFSEDGKYMAFEESGEWDVHRGGDYATTYFIDVSKNIYAAAPSIFDFSDNYDRHTGSFSRESRLERYKSSVAAGMKKFRIVSGNTGKLVVAHLESDHSFEKPVLSETFFYQKDGSVIQKMMRGYEGDKLSPEYDPFKVIFNPVYNPINPDYTEFYELNLKLHSSPKPCETRGLSVEAQMIELTLKDNTHHANLPLQILQKDKSLPESRNCPYFYTIEQVYFYKANLAVFLPVYTMGFPGSTRRYMAVTGKSNYESTQ